MSLNKVFECYLEKVWLLFGIGSNVVNGLGFCYIDYLLGGVKVVYK